MLGEVVDERHYAGSAGEDCAPLLEGEGGGDNGRGALATAADEMIEDLGGAAVSRGSSCDATRGTPRPSTRLTTLGCSASCVAMVLTGQP